MRINRPPGVEVVARNPCRQLFLLARDVRRRLRYRIILVTWLPSPTIGTVPPHLVARRNVPSLLPALGADGLWLPARVPCLHGAIRLPVLRHRHLRSQVTATAALGAYRLKRPVCPLRVGELKARLRANPRISVLWLHPTANLANRCRRM